MNVSVACITGWAFSKRLISPCCLPCDWSGWPSRQITYLRSGSISENSGPVVGPIIKKYSHTIGQRKEGICIGSLVKVKDKLCRIWQTGNCGGGQLTNETQERFSHRGVNLSLGWSTGVRKKHLYSSINLSGEDGNAHRNDLRRACPTRKLFSCEHKKIV